MTITYTQSYTLLPTSTDAQTPVKGRAHDSYWAQTMARNAAQMVSKGRGPVVMCGWTDGESSGVDTLGSNRGRAFVPYPYSSLRVMAKAKKVTYPGTITVYASGVPWSAATPNSGDGSVVLAVTSATIDAVAGTIDLTGLMGEDRVLYVYTMIKYVDMRYIVAYLDNYTG
jgi:hypothetical protein